MSHSNPFLVLLLVASLSLHFAHAQSPAATPESPPAPTGSVTGFVYYGETQLPIRFAEINLVPIPAKSRVEPARSEPTPPIVPKRDRHVQSVRGSSGMDGSFRLEAPEGDYLVAALMPGYITPGAAAAMDFSLSEEKLESLLASLPQVHIVVGQTASVSLTLHRGAVISGRMQFADGSPAVETTVECESVDSISERENLQLPENRGKVPSLTQQALESLSSSQRTQRALPTDDEGRYRISGLLPGKYILSTIVALSHTYQRVVMNDGSSPKMAGREHAYPEMIPVYAPSAFRRKDAKAFEVRGDEHITDANLTIDPGGLHTLRGRVLAAQDRHAPMTLIQLKEQGSKSISRFVEIEDDGTFQVNYLPSGSYALQIAANDIHNEADIAAQPGVNKMVIRVEYKVVELSAVIADQDVTLDEVLLVPLKPGEHNPL